MKLEIDGRDLRIGVAVVRRQRKIVSIQRPLDDVFVDVQRPLLVWRERRRRIHQPAGIRTGPDLRRSPIDQTAQIREIPTAPVSIRAQTVQRDV